MSELSPGLVERALAKLGFDAEPGIDREGLERLYLAWCRSVPFDNVRKRIAMLERTPGPLPGGLPGDFLSAWLEHGTGGTCWPSSAGLHALVSACGFDVRRISASMGDRNDHNHGSLVVRLGGAEWLVDSSILNEAPIPLRRDREHIHTHALHPIRLEPGAAGLLIHWGRSGSQDTMPCRLMDDPVDEAFYLERYEISRDYGVFNTALYARRNFDERLVSFFGRTRFEKTAAGVTSRELSADELRAALVGEIGFSEAIIARLEAARGLA
jgi:N-hydroxyarylamine O-acetyltransferase